MRFLYRDGLILETCHICMDSLIISLHGNVNNSKFIKKIPLNFDQHPTPLKLEMIMRDITQNEDFGNGDTTKTVIKDGTMEIGEDNDRCSSVRKTGTPRTGGDCNEYSSGETKTQLTLRKKKLSTVFIMNVNNVRRHNMEFRKWQRLKCIKLQM